MSEEQAVSVFFEARGELRAFINIYFLAIAALLGWLFTHRRLSWYFRIFLALGFLSLATLNWLGIKYSFLIIDAAQWDLKAIGKAVNPNIVYIIKGLPFSGNWVLGGHIVLDLLMLALIFRDLIWDRIRPPSATY